MKLYLLLILAVICLSSQAQNNVGINTNTPDSSALLHLESTDKGFLPPRLTDIQRNAISSPAEGLVIYNTTDSVVEYYDGTCWIPAYQDGCDACNIDLQFTQSSYVIDRVNTLNINIPGTAVASGNSTTMDITAVSNFSHETTLALNKDSLNTTGQFSLDISTNVFETGGIHTITFIASCGTSLFIESIQVDASLCDQVVLSADQINYDLSTAGPDGSNCIVVTVNENIGVRSSDVTMPAFTTGSLTGCNIGILNNGYIYGKGGDGPLLMGEDGQDGGGALHLTCDTEIRNNGMIYGGGGSGLTVGSFTSAGIGPITVCFAIGAGGGAGMPDGIGGGSNSGGTCTTVIGIWEPGNDAGTEYDDNEGAPVSETQSFNIPTPVVSGTIVISVHGGGGGDFGEDGTGSSQPIDFTGSELNIVINIPFVGDITIPIPLGPILNPIANSINNAVNSSVPGVGGYSIKHNGNTINVLDGDYQTYQLRGAVEN